TTLHLLPFQCSTNSAEKLSEDPTAQTLFVEMAVTADSSPPCDRFGLETTLHLVPFECSINGSPTEPETRWLPTAQTSLLAAAATQANSRPLPERVGMETTFQLVPLKCSASVTSLEEVEPGSEPTAHMSLWAIAATPLSPEPVICGLGTRTRLLVNK